MEYSVFIKTPYSKKRITRQYSSSVDNYLNIYNKKNTLKICETVKEETEHNIYDVVSEVGAKLGLSGIQIRYLAETCLNRFYNLARSCTIQDNWDKLPEVRTMYECIWRDPAKTSKLASWSSAKNLNISDGPPQGGDEMILSTVAKIRDSAAVELVTLDNDFIIFSQEIKKIFDVDVMDASQL